MDSDNHKAISKPAKREDRPKSSPKEDLDYRISGLEKAKQESGMTAADIGALNRAIAKLNEKKAAALQAGRASLGEAEREKAVKPTTQEQEQI